MGKEQGPTPTSMWEYSRRNTLVNPDWTQLIENPFPVHLKMASAISNELLSSEDWGLRSVVQASSRIHGQVEKEGEPINYDTLFFVFENNLRTKKIRNGSGDATSVLKDRRANRLANYLLFPPLGLDLSDYEFINEALLDTDRRVVSMRSFFNGIRQEGKNFLGRKREDSIVQTGVVIFEVFTEKVETLIKSLEEKTQEAFMREQQFRATVARNPSSIFTPNIPRHVETTSR